MNDEWGFSVLVYSGKNQLKNNLNEIHSTLDQIKVSWSCIIEDPGTDISPKIDNCTMVDLDILH